MPALLRLPRVTRQSLASGGVDSEEDVGGGKLAEVVAPPARNAGRRVRVQPVEPQDQPGVRPLGRNRARRIADRSANVATEMMLVTVPTSASARSTRRRLIAVTSSISCGAVGSIEKMTWKLPSPTCPRMVAGTVVAARSDWVSRMQAGSRLIGTHTSVTTRPPPDAG